MKAYTNIEQSKKLAEILPLESANMYYALSEDESKNMVNFGKPQGFFNKTQVTWSLAALLDVLPKIFNNETLFIETSAALWHIGYRNIYTARADNLVDACYEMILKLNELNLL